MCEPISLTLAVTAAIALSTTSAVMQQQQAQAQKKLAKNAANLKRTQVAQKQALGAERSADKMFQLAKKAQLLKGVVASQNLADRSVAAIGRSIGFELGQDKATLKRNQDIAALETGARLRGIDLDLESQLLQIGDTSGVRLGLQIGEGVVSAAGMGISGAAGFSSPSGGASPSAVASAQLAIPTPQISAGFTSAALTR